MFSTTEKKLIGYTAIFITVIFNSSRLMALKPGAFIAQYWHFNGYELLCQALLNLAVCFAAAYIDILGVQKSKHFTKGISVLVGANALLLAAGIFFGFLVQVRLFGDDTPATVFRVAYTLRLLASQVLMGILIKILLIVREGKAKERENEQLRSAYLKAQLQLLKDELNPHFFFNTLSSLSAIVREDPAKAQHYISHLSKMFRHSLNRPDNNMVTVKEEMAMLESYTALLKLRLEEGLIINTIIPPQYNNALLPCMSLQPLLENAVKHNMANETNPLRVAIFFEGGMLVFQNNLQPLRFALPYFNAQRNYY